MGLAWKVCEPDALLDITLEHARLFREQADRVTDGDEAHDRVGNARRARRGPRSRERSVPPLVGCAGEHGGVRGFCRAAHARLRSRRRRTSGADGGPHSVARVRGGWRTVGRWRRGGRSTWRRLRADPADAPGRARGSAAGSSRVRRGCLAPLVLAPHVGVDRRPITVGEVHVGDAPAHPVRVAHVVEAAELAVELPQPRVVTHPVGAEVDEPRLAHPAVVVDRRIPRRRRAHSASQCTRCCTSGTLRSSGRKKRGTCALLVTESQRLHAVEPHSDTHVPAHHVGDSQRTLHERTELVTDLASSHQRGSAPRRRAGSAAYASSMRAISSSEYGSMTVSSYLPPRLGLVALGADHQPVFASRDRGSRATNTSPLHSCTARAANSDCLSCTPTSALRRITRMPGRSGAHHSRKLPA